MKAMILILIVMQFSIVYNLQFYSSIMKKFKFDHQILLNIESIPSKTSLLFSSNNNVERINSIENELSSMKEEINYIIDDIIEKGRNSKDLLSLDPTILLENSHIITKGRLYEEVMLDKMKETSNLHDTKELERVDALLKGFITTERKARARMKMNYMLAGAGTNRLEEAIQLLSDRYSRNSIILEYIHY